MDKPNVVVVGYGFAGRWLAVIQAAQQSAATGQAVRLDERRDA
jgi:hypothetical protein